MIRVCFTTKSNDCMENWTFSVNNGGEIELKTYLLYKRRFPNDPYPDLVKMYNHAYGVSELSDLLIKKEDVKVTPEVRELAMKTLLKQLKFVD